MNIIHQTPQGRAIGKIDIGGDYSYERLQRFLDEP